MTSNANGWVQVRDPQELRAGALVELRPCGFCGKTERFMLLRGVTPTTGASLKAEGDFQDSHGCWAIAPGLCLNRNRPFDPTAAIAGGRLWRRADLNVSDDLTASSNGRLIEFEPVNVTAR